jgi:hypothetical protein
VEGATSDDSQVNLWSGSFTVHKTTTQPKRGLGAKYFAYVNPADKEALEALGLKNHLVVVRRFETAEQAPEGERPPEMRARCRLRVSDGTPPADGSIGLDQTLRNAIGIPVEPQRWHTADLGPLNRSRARSIAEALGDFILRRRYLFMRVRKADPSDMEKRMVRIPADSFRLLGVSSGEKVRIGHPDGGPAPGFEEKHCTLQAYPVTPEIVDRQQSKSDWGLYDRYPDPDRLMKVRPDLGAIYLDQGAREKLGVRTLEVVRVRRADVDAFLQRIRSFGLAVAATAIAIIGVFPIDKTVVNGVKVLLIAVAIAVAISILDLRSSSYGSPN